VNHGPTNASGRPQQTDFNDRCRIRRPARAIAVSLATAFLYSGLVSVALAADVAEERVADDRINYSLGYAFGEHLANLRRQGITADPEEIFRGLLDALAGAQPSVSQNEMRKALDALGETTAVADRQEASGAARAFPPPGTQKLARARKWVDDFAHLNAQRPGVVTLPSGVQYEVLKAGSGPRPAPGDTIAIQYEGKLATGVVFDTTYDDGEPLRLAIDSVVVPGLREALLLMHQGDKWRIVIPPSMGFGRIGNNQLRKRDLIYELELVSVESPPKESSSQEQSAKRPEPGEEPAAGTPE